ncbi:MAG: hypothetical protein ACLP1D_03520 [Xanthobacteraceae bacterium]|jgi:hypothetical protein
MDVKAKVGRRKLAPPVAEDYEFSFVPGELRSQCHRLIVSFHEMHGYPCLPDMLWKAGLASLIEKHKALNEALQKASTARSARRANEYFIIVAAEILALEILARDYANWSGALPSAKATALELLGGNTPVVRTWLIEHYLYPPRYDTPAARVGLTPPPPSLGASLQVPTEAGSRGTVAIDRPDGRTVGNVSLGVVE